jgi:hypothetical protein
VRLDAAAQQLSACAWLITCVEPEPRDSDLCIGHLVPFVQHAIRASGVGCHPAQTDTFPTHSVRTAAIAASRLVSVSTYVGCGTTAALSNRHRPRRTVICHSASGRRSDAQQSDSEETYGPRRALAHPSSLSAPSRLEPGLRSDM